MTSYLISSMIPTLPNESVEPEKEFLLDVLAVVVEVAGIVIGVNAPSPHEDDGAGICSMSTDEGCRMILGVLVPSFSILMSVLGVLAPSFRVLDSSIDACVPSGCFSLK